VAEGLDQTRGWWGGAGAGGFQAQAGQGAGGDGRGRAARLPQAHQRAQPSLLHPPTHKKKVLHPHGAVHGALRPPRVQEPGAGPAGVDRALTGRWPRVNCARPERPGRPLARATHPHTDLPLTCNPHPPPPIPRPKGVQRPGAGGGRQEDVQAPEELPRGLGGLDNGGGPGAGSDGFRSASGTHANRPRRFQGGAPPRGPRRGRARGAGRARSRGPVAPRGSSPGPPSPAARRERPRVHSTAGAAVNPPAVSNCRHKPRVFSTKRTHACLALGPARPACASQRHRRPLQGPDPARPPPRPTPPHPAPPRPSPPRPAAA
jgi:hypothetical protein